MPSGHGQHFGVSDNAGAHWARKWAKRNALDLSPCDGRQKENRNKATESTDKATKRPDGEQKLTAPSISLPKGLPLPTSMWEGIGEGEHLIE